MIIIIIVIIIITNTYIYIYTHTHYIHNSSPHAYSKVVVEVPEGGYGRPRSIYIYI